MLYALKDLSETLNKKWSELQVQEYLRCINDIHSYIIANFLTHQYVASPGSPPILYYEDFQNTMIQYGDLNNPIGYDLYVKQLDYMKKKATGHDFWEKGKKGTTENKPEQKKRQIVDKKEEVVIRKDDP